MGGIFSLKQSVFIALKITFQLIFPLPAQQLQVWKQSVNVIVINIIVKVSINVPVSSQIRHLIIIKLSRSFTNGLIFRFYFFYNTIYDNGSKS